MKGFGNKVLPSVGDDVEVDAVQARAEGGWLAQHVVLVKEEQVWDNEENDDFRCKIFYETYFVTAYCFIALLPVYFIISYSLPVHGLCGSITFKCVVYAWNRDGCFNSYPNYT